MHRDSVAPSELLIRDEHAIGGYHRRLSSTAPSELSNVFNVRRPIEFASIKTVPCRLPVIAVE
jgi:hypothetical protein